MQLGSGVVALGAYDPDMTCTWLFDAVNAAAAVIFPAVPVLAAGSELTLFDGSTVGGTILRRYTSAGLVEDSALTATGTTIFVRFTAGSTGNAGAAVAGFRVSLTKGPLAHWRCSHLPPARRTVPRAPPRRLSYLSVMCTLTVGRPARVCLAVCCVVQLPCTRVQLAWLKWVMRSALPTCPSPEIAPARTSIVRRRA